MKSKHTDQHTVYSPCSTLSTKVSDEKLRDLRGDVLQISLDEIHCNLHQFVSNSELQQKTNHFRFGFQESVFGEEDRLCVLKETDLFCFWSGE